MKRAASGKCIWHDNEKFLKQADVYQQSGLKMVNFPPNSGDLNPIENVWSELRKELALREFEDIAANRTLTVQQFRQRAAQILNSFQVPNQVRRRATCRSSSRECRAAWRNAGTTATAIVANEFAWP